MAHPLTQQPPSSLPFAFAARPSPLAFGFGLPSSTSAFSTPLKPSAGTASWSTPAFSPSRNSLPRLRSDTAVVTPQASLKRSRRSPSPSSASSSPPPSSPASSSSHIRPDRLTSRVDLSAVAGLALQDGTGLGSASAGQKSAKRSRLDAAQAAQTSAGDIEVGILLATLPPSSHLPILLQILQLQPSLASTVLSQIPQLDLRACAKELSVHLERIKRAAGPNIAPSTTLNATTTNRRWDRVREETEVFCRTASTYIRHFTSPTTQTSPVDVQSLFTFLHALTDHLHLLIRLVPSSSPPTNVVLELAKLALATWTSWVNILSSEVNQKSGMYPYSVVTHWADALGQLSEGIVDPVGSSSGGWSMAGSQSSHWSFPSTAAVQDSPSEYETSFRQAVSSVKERFLTEVGWLIGRGR